MSQISQAPSFKWNFLHPRYLHTWLGMGLLYLLSWLPFRLQRFLGFKLGLLLKVVLKRRKIIAERNLELCFPTMPLAERERLLTENFKHAGFALFETGIAWFWPDWRIKKIFEYEGLEHLDSLYEGKGTLIITTHCFNLELCARGMSTKQYGYGVYRPNSNPVYDWFQYRGRSRRHKLVDRRDVKKMVKVLKKGRFLWYLPDHDYGKHHYNWAPFFAVEKACTTKGTYTLASITRSQVMSLSIVGLEKGYKVKISPILKDFPYDDAQKAAIFTNKVIEASIMAAPEQYMWLHRRFKSRPEGEPSLYD